MELLFGGPVLIVPLHRIGEKAVGLLRRKRGLPAGERGRKHLLGERPVGLHLVEPAFVRVVEQHQQPRADKGQQHEHHGQRNRGAFLFPPARQRIFSLHQQNPPCCQSWESVISAAQWSRRTRPRRRCRAESSSPPGGSAAASAPRCAARPCPCRGLRSAGPRRRARRNR